MLLDVTVRQKGQVSEIENAECTVFDMKRWCQKGAMLSKELGVEILVKFQAQSHEFTFSPEESQESVGIYLQRNGVSDSTGIAQNTQVVDPALAAQFEGS